MIIIQRTLWYTCSSLCMLVASVASSFEMLHGYTYHRKSFAVRTVQRGNRPTLTTLMVKKKWSNICMYRIRVIQIPRVGIDHLVYYYYYYCYYKNVGSAIEGENAYQFENSIPKTPTHSRKEDNGKYSKRQKGNEQPMPIKNISPALKTRQSHTIEYRVSKIVPQRYCAANTSHAVLRGSAARRHTSIPMCNLSTVCNPHWNIRHRKSTVKRAHRVTPNLIEQK